MDPEAKKLNRSVVCAAFAALALMHIVPAVTEAEEPPAEEAVEAAAKEASEATGAAEDEAKKPVDVADRAAALEAYEETAKNTGGVPAQPMDAESAVVTVKAAMANIEKDVGAMSEAYTIRFGDTFDWVQMVSGEWIKGDIDRMRDETLEFDSDKLDMLYLDFADVALVHSPQANTYVFDDRVSATGPAVITADSLIVQTDEGTKVFPRSEIESIIEGERERDWWSMTLRTGLVLNRGNTDQLTWDIMFNTRREDHLTLLDLNYNATFGRTDGEQNVHRHLAEELFQVFLGSRWWVTPLFGQLLNDRFQNIKLRATPAAGAGVHIIDAPKVQWDFQTGIGYQYLNYLNASQLGPGQEDPQHDVFVPLFTYWDFEITGDIDLTLSWLTNLVVTTIGNTNHTGKADLAIELTSVLDLNVAFLFLRTEEPAPPPDPADPPIEKNDYQLIVGISLELG